MKSTKLAGVEGLTASEVIERLRHVPPDSLVVVEGRYGGFDTVRAALPVKLATNVNHDPDFGPHEKAEKDVGSIARAVALVCRPPPSE